MKAYPKLLICVIIFSFFITETQAQRETNKWKLQLAVGLNRPFWDGFVDGLNSNDYNAPTVNLGVQHMFNERLGVKVDYGFNRFKNADDVPEFKINYSRVNAQLVYDPSNDLLFLPMPLRLILHAGPGYSFAKPLALLGDNKQTYLNAMGGLEIHYALSERLSVYADVAYVYGFTELEDYNPPISGLGAFNGNLLYGTIGLTVSLSGCYTCSEF